MTTTATTGEVLTMSSTDYHASERLSNSRLNIHKDSPALYHARFIAKTVPPPESTPQQRKGTLIHAGVLERGLGTSMLRIPRDVLNKDGHRKGGTWLAWQAENYGKELLTDAEADEIERAVESVLSHPLARCFLDGKVEQTIHWVHEWTGLECKSRLDSLMPDFIMDLKTTDDHRPSAFAKSCRTWRYDAQQAYYVDAVKAATGKELPFVFVAVNKSAPYSVRVYELDPRDVRFARDANERAMRDLADRLSTNHWLEPGAHEITTLTLPKNWNADYEL